MRLSGVFVISSLTLASNPAAAADTVETWDAGATDIDFYLGLDGIGPRGNRAVFSEMMVGYGIVDGFSGYLTAHVHANEFFAEGETELHLGFFGTPVNTDHFDLDLFLDVGTGAVTGSEVELTPSTELNFDMDPNMGSWGVYLRAGMPLRGRSISNDAHELALQVETNLGTYWTVADGHQILLEYDMAFLPKPAEEERAVEVGGLAFGYNVTLSAAIELINQVYVTIPRSGESAEVGVMSGFIATLPSGAN